MFGRKLISQRPLVEISEWNSKNDFLLYGLRLCCDICFLRLPWHAHGHTIPLQSSMGKFWFAVRSTLHTAIASMKSTTPVDLLNCNVVRCGFSKRRPLARSKPTTHDGTQKCTLHLAHIIHGLPTRLWCYVCAGPNAGGTLSRAIALFSGNTFGQCNHLLLDVWRQRWSGC